MALNSGSVNCESGRHRLDPRRNGQVVHDCLRDRVGLLAQPAYGQSFHIARSSDDAQATKSLTFGI